MKKQLLLLLAACSITVGCVRPSFAGIVGNVGGLLGGTTAAIIDTPEGMLLDSLWRCPVHYTHALADAFGDEKGFGQNVVGGLIGIPYGVVVGIPVGAIQGAKHGWSTGLDKPFSGESFVVPDEENSK